MNNNEVCRNNPVQTMNVVEIKPWRRVIDMTLIILCWLTLSPLMSVVNKNETYFKRRTMIRMTILSPFTWTLFSIVLLVVGLPLLIVFSPQMGSVMLSFPELNFAMSQSANFFTMILVAYFLPIYAFCVVVLFVAMAFTGWTYREASVYICEYFEPWFCVAVAIGMIIWIAANMGKMNIKGKLLAAVPIVMEGVLAWHNAEIYFQRVASYRGMSVNGIFDYVVGFLIELGNATGTDYVTANMIVYIFPLLAILFVGYLGWIIYTLNNQICR